MRAHTHAYTYEDTQTPPLTQGQTLPLLLPTTLPTASPLNLPLLPHPNLLYLVSSKDGGKKKEEEEEVEERGRWAREVDVCCLQKNPQHPSPFLLGSGLVRSDIVLFSVCES